MPYVTQAILVDRNTERRIIELTDRDEPSTGAIGVDVLNRAIADTDAVIDGYLAGRYALPLAETPALLVDLGAAITLYKLHIYEAPTKVEQDYKDALAMLSRIAKGEVRLPVAGIEPESSGASGVVTVDRERPFTEANLKGFI